MKKSAQNVNTATMCIIEGFKALYNGLKVILLLIFLQRSGIYSNV